MSDANLEADIEDVIEDATDEVAKLTTTVQQQHETIIELSEMLQQEEDAAKKSHFCYENIKYRDDLVKFTPDFQTI